MNDWTLIKQSKIYKMERMTNEYKNTLIADNVVKPDYKKTKLGWIPVEWEVVKLKDIAKVGNGTTPSRKNKNYWINGSIPWLPTGKVNEKEIYHADEFITERALEETSLKVLPINTVLIGMIGQGKTRGMAAIIKLEATVNQNFAYIISQEKLNPIFLFNKLSFDYQHLRGSGRGGGQKSLNCKIIKSYAIPLPPLFEQKKIAAILSTWDKAITMTQQLIAAKEEQKKGLMQRLLTGKVRVKRFNGVWKEVKLGDIFKERKERGFDNLELLSIGADGVYPQSESNKKDNSNSDKSKYKRICLGDIGYNTMRMWQGRSAVSSLEGIVSPAYTIVTPQKGIDVNFMGYLFKLPETIHSFWRYSQGLVSDTLNCKFPSFALVKVKIPPTYKEQVAISKILKTADDEIKILTKKLDELKEQKKGLMQRLLTGKIRVNN